MFKRKSKKPKPLPLLCSDCFKHWGLKLDALRISKSGSGTCPNCGSAEGALLTSPQAERLAYRFFVLGSVHETDYGSAPLIQFNSTNDYGIQPAKEIEPDMRLLESVLGIRFFNYGPRLWMIGEIEPLKDLQKAESRSEVLKQIANAYPTKHLSECDVFFRVRKNPSTPSQASEYDSPPSNGVTDGRFNSPSCSVLYGSPDLQTCLHECRTSIEDHTYAAVLRPIQSLQLLDLTEILEEDGTEFESLDLAVNFLFRAGSHSYEISQSIAAYLLNHGFDGLIYPSFFSLLRTGGEANKTVYGISARRFPGFVESERRTTVPNFALFGRPVSENKVIVESITRVFIERAEYHLRFGPSDV